jgi:hypothetical protein
MHLLGCMQLTYSSRAEQSREGSCRVVGSWENAHLADFAVASGINNPGPIHLVVDEGPDRADRVHELAYDHAS